MIKSLDWVIDPTVGAVHFTVTQHIALTPITFSIPFHELFNITGQAMIIDAKRRQPKPALVTE
jgi:hypothetical protein